MTGILGYFSPRADNVPVDITHAMADVMRHHDYYQIDIAPAGGSGALGRIGIGLLNSEPQPLVASAGRVVLVLCGEFYHLPFRKPDASEAQIALDTYLESGATGLTNLEGMFTVSVWDGRSGDLWIVNDRYGLYPHYYAHERGAFVVAPEVKGILATGVIPKQIDQVAIAQYTRFQQLLGERTWFETVHLLPPATVLRYRPSSDHLSTSRYWDWDQIPEQPHDITLGEAADEVIRLFDQAIAEMTRPPLKVGVFLSGGLDGRAIMGVARDFVPMTSYTFGSEACRDVHIARRIARKSASTHFEFPMNSGSWVLEQAQEHLKLTEGFHSWMHGHGMSMLATAREHSDVNLSGWDGGTILGGYMADHGEDDLYRDATDELDYAENFFHGFSRVFTWPGMTDTEAHYLFSSPGNDSLDRLAFESLREELARTVHYPRPNRADYFYLLQHCRRSTQNMIVFTRSAVEVRCPYFDYDLVSFLYGLPTRLRRSLDLQHLVITRRMPDLARIPNERDNLPPHRSQSLRFIHRAGRKALRTINRAVPVAPDRPRLYADYEEYLRTDLVHWAEAVLFDQRTLDRGFFNPDGVRDLWNLHLRGDKLWTIGKVAPLITLEMTLRMLFDEPQSVPERQRLHLV